MSEFKIEHNVQTGEILEIPLTEKEVEELEKLRAKAAKEQAAFEAAKAKAETDKAALLARLGLTEDEAKLLLS
jgi:hypothetical protein